ncbi:MAG: hypothetical protein ABR587_10805 [Candidatus Binatia bacterium]
MRNRTITLLLLALAGGLAAGACNPARETPHCRRIDVASMGPENGMVSRVTDPSATALTRPDGEIEVALTVVPPLSSAVTLVHTQQGKEVGRWEIRMPPSPGTVHRCRIGFGTPPSSCGAELAGASHPVVGEWTIEPMSNRVLEASVSFRVCE